MHSGKVLALRYELEREIGRGTTGSVWVAFDAQLGRRVAIKVLDVPASMAGDDGLVTEAKTIALLKSPHVVQVFDIAFEEQRPFIVMELLHGEDLELRLLRHPRLPLRLVASLVVDLAKGLTAIHDAGIVHRDLKPANVFLAQESGREVPKLLDFGVALLREKSGLHGHGADFPVIAGTPLYMSPEHFAGADLDERADVWSLAVIAYEMLMGSVPFQARTILELREQICSGRFARPSTILHGEAEPLDAFFDQAFALEPHRRFPNATALSEELLRIGQDDEKRVIRVLFLDDEVDMKLLLERRFRRELREGTYELHFATDGQAGLEALRQRPDIDVVLTDLNMPGMDGLTFLSHLPSVNPLVKAIVVTAYNDMANIRSAMNHGAFDFLCKPIDFDDLQRTVRKCADYAWQLRAAVDSREQNTIFRVLLGQSFADKIVTALRASDRVQSRTLEASVTFIQVCGIKDALEQTGVADGFEVLSTHFDVLVKELLARHADVSRFVQDSVMAVFEGEDHLVRAVEASLAIRERLQKLDAACPRGGGRYGVAVGLDAGSIIAGILGSLASGRLEAAAVGSPMCTASELQRIAGRHEILISAAIAGRLQERYCCQAVERAVKLEGDNLPVFKLEGRWGERERHSFNTVDCAFTGRTATGAGGCTESD